VMRTKPGARFSRGGTQNSGVPKAGNNGLRGKTVESLPEQKKSVPANGGGGKNRSKRTPNIPGGQGPRPYQADGGKREGVKLGRIQRGQ